MTVAENLRMAELRGTRRSLRIGLSRSAHARYRELLSKLGMRLEGRLNASMGTLSGGQRQGVAVARAVAGNPAILLADEPTGNLDSANGEAVMELLAELHRDGATICMVTHDERYAAHAARTIHLFDGRVVEETSMV